MAQAPDLFVQGTELPEEGLRSMWVLLREAERVEDASGVAVLARALEEALQAHKGALLSLAARLLEVLPPLDLHKVVCKDLQGNQGVCSKIWRVGECCSHSAPKFLCTLSCITC